jgi:hypothetical protein
MTTKRPAQSKSRELPPFPEIIPWQQWIHMRGISLSTADRLMREGRIKVTWLSKRRKGIRADHDREFLDSCVGTQYAAE